jgi:hypothetical protein
MEGIKRSWIDDTPPALFIEGENISLPAVVDSELLRVICDSPVITHTQIAASEQDATQRWQLIAELHNSGFFILS